jgi:hypothetical protein
MARRFLDLLRGRKRKEAEEALERLEKQSDKGPEALRRFEEATRHVMSVPKDSVVDRKK